MGQMYAVSILKGLAWRHKLFTKLLPVIPPRDQLFYNQRSLQKITISLAKELGRYKDEVTVRAMVRSVMKYFDEYETYPATYFELFQTPQIPCLLIWAR
jgi:hypothetical protein